MSHPAVYTPLESLLLFQSTLTQGVDNAAFGRIAEQLRNNALVKGDASYDSTRLSPEALQQLFFRLFHEELNGEAGARVGDAATAATTTTTVPTSTSTPTSPNSRKRKLPTPPLPSLKDVQDNIGKIPILVNRLYAQYRADIVRRIREDEKNFDTVQNMIQVIEKSENQRLAKQAAQNGAPSSAPREATKPATPAGAQTASPAPSAVLPAAAKRTTSTTPIVPPKLPTSGIAPPSHLPQGPPQVVRPPSTGVPSSGPASVLQHPVGAAQQPSGVLQAPPQAPRVSISPRPDANNQGRVAAPPPPPPPSQVTTGATQGQLKWEKPYQPPPSQTVPPRQYQSPGPPKSAVPAQQQRHPQNQQQWLNQSLQNLQPAQTPPVLSPSPGTQPTTKPPLLVPPQNVGNVMPQLQPPTARPVAVSPSPQPRTQTKSPVPPPTQHRPIQPQQGHVPPQPRPIAASPTPPGSGVSAVAPPPRWPPGQQQAQPQPSGQHLPGPGTPTPVPTASQKDKPYSANYGNQQPRPAIPEHMIRHAAAGTPLAPRRTSAVPTTPLHTPAQLVPMSLPRGNLTKWTTQYTPTTPGGTIINEAQSPSFEPLSPPLRPATLPRPAAKIPKKQAAKQPDPTEVTPLSGRGGRGRPPRGGGFRGRRPSTTPSAGAGRRSQSVVSQADELSMDHIQTTTEVKNEDATPRPHEETGDTTADESVSGRGNVVTPGSMRIPKRKRPETPADPPGPPTHVMWTRGFTKVSSSALDQISSHRDANMFATGVRERDAPNYRGIVLQPQDITSIRSAIKQGNKAAVAASTGLPSGDPGTASVWLPISEDLCPPKGIINSAQLERELVHMFCNAIMYNPDPYRGPGQAFMKRSQDDEEEAFGYQFDENGVVRNTQSMFLEVEKLLGDLRSAEKNRAAPPLSTPRLTSNAATPADDTADDEDELAGDGGEGPGAFKRRRVRN